MGLTSVHAPRTEAQFPLCTATDSRCSRKSVDLGSPDSVAIRRPRAFRKAVDLGPIAPMVSIAIGVKLWLAGSPRYFSVFLSSAFSATFPASWVACIRYEVAKVSGHVASQTSKRPACQGASVTPSGLFPSDLNRPVGSSLEGTWAAVRPRFTISLSAACRRCLPSLHLQLSACLPKALTSAEQCWQQCGPQTGAPRRRPTATLTVSSSIRRPRADTGKALNQAPDSMVDTASRRERSSSLLYNIIII